METLTTPPADTIAERFAALANLPRRDHAEVLEWQFQNETMPRLVECRLERRFHRKITDWPEPKQKSVLARLLTLCASRGAIIALVGPRGTGKTTIASQLIISRAENQTLKPWDRIVPYRKMTDLIARYKPLYADFGTIDGDSLMAARDHYCKMRLAIIDELHECDEQKLKGRVLTDILDRRYAAQRDTVIISNQTPEEFQRTTSDSVLSRLAQHGAIIPCEWGSFRTPTK